MFNSSLVDVVEEPVETHGYRGSSVVRNVLRRDGSVVEQKQTLPTNFLPSVSASSAWEAVRLRRRERPSAANGPTVTVADLFAGCGGISLGVHEAAEALGMTASTKFAVEIAPAAADVFARNFGGIDVRRSPIEELIDGVLGESPTAAERATIADLGNVTLVVAGPPCQGNSDLNNHTRGNDPKNELYLRAVRYIELVQPLHAIIENVPGVVRGKGNVVGRAVAALVSLGYQVSTGVVRADNLGAAQARRRHLLLASRVPGVRPDVDALHREFAADPTPVLAAVGDLDVEPHRGAFGTAARHSALNQARISYLFDNDLYELPNGVRPDCHRLKEHRYTSVYGRMRPDRPSPTITAGFGSTGQGRFVHPLRRRTLTPHEAARLQGFPDYFDFDAASRRGDLQQMIGNAVPTRLAYCAALSLLR